MHLPQPCGSVVRVGLLAAVLVAGPVQGREPIGAQSAPPRPAVLLIGIDGVRPDVLAEVETPVIDSLVRVGRWTDSALTTDPTVSGPGWSSMLTGVWPEKHGVTSNDFRGNRYARYPDFLTRLETGLDDMSTFAVADWPPLVSTASGGPLLGDLVDERVVFNGYVLGWDVADQRSVSAAADHIGTAPPGAVFVYLGNPDETSHHTGAIGAEYRAAIATADQQVGILLDAVRNRSSAEEESWLVLISTDHGRRADGGHGGDSPEERTIFILAAGDGLSPGLLPAGAGIVDVAAMALGHFGLDPGAAGIDGRNLLGGVDAQRTLPR